MGVSGGGKNGACEEKIASQESVMEILSNFTGITASDLITSAFQYNDVNKFIDSPSSLFNFLSLCPDKLLPAGPPWNVLKVRLEFNS